VFVAGKHERDRKEQQEMQRVMLIGNLGRDPDVKYSQQGTAIAQFSVATTERWKDKGGELQEHTEWFAVKTFGRVPRYGTSPASERAHLPLKREAFRYFRRSTIGAVPTPAVAL
jgi:hypothetical protein